MPFVPRKESKKTIDWCMSQVVGAVIKYSEAIKNEIPSYTSSVKIEEFDQAGHRLSTNVKEGIDNIYKVADIVLMEKEEKYNPSEERENITLWNLDVLELSLKQFKTYVYEQSNCDLLEKYCDQFMDLIRDELGDFLNSGEALLDRKNGWLRAEKDDD